MIAKFTTIIAALATIASASPIAAAPGVGVETHAKRQMYKYCDDDAWHMSSGTILNGVCHADDGTVRQESIDLNLCLANANGNLVHFVG